MSSPNEANAVSPNAESAPARPIETSEILLRLRAISAQLESVKALYVEADALTLELVRRGFSSESLPDGTLVQLCDNFVDSKTGEPRNVAWRSSGQRRFEVDFSDPLTVKRSKSKGASK